MAKDLSYLSRIKEKKMEYISTNDDIFLILNNITYVQEKLDVDMHDVIVILYLYELSTFKMNIQLYDKRHNLIDFLNKGYIKKDINFEKQQWYCLTDFSYSVIYLFEQSFKSKKEYSLRNKVINKSDNSFIKKALSDYAKKK